MTGKQRIAFAEKHKHIFYDVVGKKTSREILEDNKIYIIASREKAKQIYTNLTKR